jgi:aminoglycoside phosphotransferase
MTELPGGTAAEEFRESGADRIAIVDALVLFLRHFHALPLDACPIKSDHHLNILLQEGKVVGVIDVARVGIADR